MEPERLQSLKAYMRVDWDEDDAVIELMYLAAVGYLTTAGVRDDGSALYELAVNGLTLNYYDHRDAAGSGIELTPGLRQAITQLKLTNGGGADG